MFTLALRKFELVLGLFALQCHMQNDYRRQIAYII